MQTRLFKIMQTNFFRDADHADQLFKSADHNSKIMQTKILFVADHADQL